MNIQIINMRNDIQKKSILIIVENLPLPFDRRVWQECIALKENGYNVYAICPTGKGFEEKYQNIQGVHIYRHPLPYEASGILGYFMEYSTALMWEFYLSLKIWKKHGFDVIQACNPPDLIFLVGMFFKYFLGKKFIFDHHDINPELYLAKFGRKDIFYNILIYLERITFKIAYYSIATNNSYRKIAIERGKMPPEKIAVVRSGPNLQRLRPSQPQIAWKNGRTYLVGYVGVMGQQEGIDHLLKAAEILIRKKKRTDVQFVLVGDGTEYMKLKELCTQLRLNAFVTFTGRVPDDVLIEVLCTTDICINPDIANDMNNKSTMNKIMEYMAFGKPIVQYDLVEGRYSAGKASVYAQPNNIQDLADKISLLLDDPERRKIMGEYGYERVFNELHWGIESQKYISLYKIALFS